MGIADSIMDWFFDNILPWLGVGCVVLLLLFIAALPFLIWGEAKAERFSLRKDEWDCSRSVDVPITTYIQSGNVMVPITTYTKSCVQWSRR